MSKKYFRLYEDLYVPGRWLLGHLYDESGTRVDAYKFAKGVPLAVDGRVRITIHQPGTPLDLSHLVGDPVPVVSRRVAEALTALAANDLQLIPVHIEAQAAEYYLVNATRTVKCIDDASSAEVQYWRPEDGRPDKVGKYRAVYDMRVNPDLIPSHIQMFRAEGWTIALVVSAEFRGAMERIGATGMKFIPV